MLFLSCMWLVRAACAAQDSFSVRTWQVPDGSTGTIFGLAQSPDGYLWIGTTGGLTQFDGVNFQTHFLGEPFGLPDSRVRMLLTSKTGAMWVALDGAVVLLRNNAPPIVVKQSVPTERVESMAEDKDGALWLGYRSGPICRVSGTKAEVFDTKEGFPDIGTSSAVPSLAVDSAGQVWLARGQRLGMIRDGHYSDVKHMPATCFIAAAAAGGIWICAGTTLYKFDGSEAHRVATLPNSHGRIEPLRLYEDHHGALWLGTSSDGLFRCDGAQFQNIATPQAQITCLTEDHEGNLWAGSDSGLDRVSPREIETEGAENGLPLGAVRSICQAPDGQIWAAMANNGIMVRDDKGWSPAPFAMDDSAFCITAGADGSIWIGTQSRHIYRWKSGKLSQWDHTAGVESHVITALLAARNGDLWVGSTSGNTLQCFRAGQFVNIAIPHGNGQVDALAEDRQGNIWVGRSGSGGLLRITNDKVIDETPADNHWSVHGILAMPDDTLWMAVYGQGLGRWKDGHLSMVTAAQGLIQDHISQIISDGRGWLWLGSDQGIFKASLHDLNDCADGKRAHVQCIQYGGNEGLPPLQARYGQCPNSLRSTDGRLWLTMATTLAIAHPERVHETSEPPRISLERVLLDDGVIAASPGYFSIPAKPLDPASGTVLRLDPGYHRLEFDFTALTFRSPEDTRFRYRLEGFENTWNETTGPRKAVYPKLPAGQYRFHVIACDADGTWNEQGAAASIAVARFFWQTAWFISAATVLGIGALLLVIRFVALRRLRRRLQVLEQRSALDRERARIARDIHDDLGHGLTQIVLLSDLDTDEKLPSDELAGQLRQIATTAKQGIKSLDETVWAINPRNDTLPDVIDYLGEFVVQSVRAAGIRCELNLPDRPPTIAVPSEVRHNLFLAVKEAVNNALRHAQAGKVTLAITVDGHTISICIADDGRGFDPASIHSHNGNGQHDGLRNMQQRMLDVGGTFDLASAPAAGTRLCLQLNLNQVNRTVTKDSKADFYADHSLHR